MHVTEESSTLTPVSSESEAAMNSMHASAATVSRDDENPRGQRPIGHSSAWSDVMKRAERVAKTDATTCLQGESGTGKEVVARFIHQASWRRRGPFVAINCAALPEQLLESEMFGFERGAFTGAQQSKRGQIEVASGGVLFLDEITEMPLAAQAKVLRVLQERELTRLGATRPVAVDVRVIVAANRDLDEAVANGTLRADLYFRLNVFDIHLPPLRNRPDDIAPLAEHFLRELSRNGTPAELSPEAVDTLLVHDWPGNVRELRNVLERATIVCDDGLIRARDLSLRRGVFSAVDTTKLNVLECRAIERVMREVNGNKSQAAGRLGISRTQLYMRLRKYGLVPTDAASLDTTTA
jgi:transcriptional regulator with PAS, ATPase and Fis domain